MPGTYSTRWLRFLSMLFLSCSLCLVLGCSGSDDDDSGADDDDTAPDDDDTVPDDDDDSPPAAFEIEILVSIDPSLSTPDGTPAVALALFEEGGLSPLGLPASEPVTEAGDVEYTLPWPVSFRIDAPASGTFEAIVILDASGDGDICSPGDYAGHSTVSTGQSEAATLVLDYEIEEGDCEGSHGEEK